MNVAGSYPHSTVLPLVPTLLREVLSVQDFFLNRLLTVVRIVDLLNHEVGVFTHRPFWPRSRDFCRPVTLSRRRYPSIIPHNSFLYRTNLSMKIPCENNDVTFTNNPHSRGHSSGWSFTHRLNPKTGTWQIFHSVLRHTSDDLQVSLRKQYSPLVL